MDRAKYYQMFVTYAQSLGTFRTLNSLEVRQGIAEIYSSYGSEGSEISEEDVRRDAKTFVFGSRMSDLEERAYQKKVKRREKDKISKVIETDIRQRKARSEDFRKTARTLTRLMKEYDEIKGKNK